MKILEVQSFNQRELLEIFEKCLENRLMSAAKAAFRKIDEATLESVPLSSKFLYFATFYNIPLMLER